MKMKKPFIWITIFTLGLCLTSIALIGQSIPSKLQLKSAILNPMSKSSVYDSTLFRCNRIMNVNHVSPDFIFNNYYGRICKWETKRDNRSRQKVRFRIGDPSYVDKLEGK